MKANHWKDNRPTFVFLTNPELFHNSCLDLSRTTCRRLQKLQKWKKLKEEENRVKEECFDEISIIAVNEIAFLYKKDDEEQLDD